MSPLPSPTAHCRASSAVWVLSRKQRSKEGCSGAVACCGMVQHRWGIIWPANAPSCHCPGSHEMTTRMSDCLAYMVSIVPTYFGLGPVNPIQLPISHYPSITLARYALALLPFNAYICPYHLHMYLHSGVPRTLVMNMRLTVVNNLCLFLWSDQNGAVCRDLFVSL